MVLPLPSALSLVVAVVCLVPSSWAANWAQTTGKLKQNTVIPYIPSQQQPHWSGRFGMATAISNISDNGESLFRTQSYVMLIGGDDFWVDAMARPHLDEHNKVHGLHNDVWRLAAPEAGRTWYVGHDMVDRGRYDHKLPKIHSQLAWEQMSPGVLPRQGETYEEFIQCQAAYPQPQIAPDANCANDRGADGRPRGWFSARRMHQVAIYKHKVFVIGGRAREHALLDPDRVVGGIVGARVKEGEFVAKEHDPIHAEVHPVHFEPSMREVSVLKNDVWVSEDWGRTWTLIQPGCKSNQIELLLEDRESTASEPKLAEMFNPALRCVSDKDCYGNQEVCQAGVCVCELWSPREQHRVAVYGGYMYLVGGFASKHLSYCHGRACGDIDAGSYRAYMNDVWYSDLESASGAAGATWLSLTSGAEFPRRGGHAMAIMAQLYTLQPRASIPGAGNNNNNNNERSSGYALYVFGGRTGDTEDKSKDAVLNDVWYTELPPEGADPAFMQQNGWTQIKDADWEPRTGHTAVVDPPSAANGYSQRVFVQGGESLDGALFGDSWSWGWECKKDPVTGVAYVDGDQGPECSREAKGGTLVNASKWRRDYDPDALWRFDSGGDFVYDQGQPQQHYIDGNSPIEALVKVYLPLGNDAEAFDAGMPSQLQNDMLVYGVTPRREPVIDPNMLDFLHELDVHTVRDLAEIELWNVLRIRGYIPQEPASKRFMGRFEELEKTGYDFDAICNHRALARDTLRRCSVDMHLNELVHYDQEQFMPWNVKPDFIGETPSGEAKNYWEARWHGKSFLAEERPSDDYLVEHWDGCTNFGLDPVDVAGIGEVKVPSGIRDPYREAQELVCKSNPGPRAYHVGVYMDQKIYVMGGITPDAPNLARPGPTSTPGGNLTSTADMWYRDDRIPRATIVERPRELVFSDDFFNIFATAEDDFRIKGDKEGLIFNYLIYDVDEHTIARTWDKTKGNAHVNWLDYWWEDGPGSGTYLFYARCVDPAGNLDVTYGLENMYKWKYQTALPWDIISGCCGGFSVLCFGLWWEYKRRKKKKAMERYAIKRMRRKFKGAQKELSDKAGVDWKAMIDKDKKKGGKDKKKKKSKEKSKEKDKEKDKKKKEKSKEKEKLKKKKE